jgi:hypothetical protein
MISILYTVVVWLFVMSVLLAAVRLFDTFVSALKH